MIARAPRERSNDAPPGVGVRIAGTFPTEEFANVGVAQHCFATTGTSVLDFDVHHLNNV